MKRLAVAAFAAACISIAPLIAFAADAPDATIDLNGGSVALGVGVNWAKGTLHYHGQSIPISVKGVSVLNVGATSISAAGEVYHLKDVADFAGNYTAVSAGAALAGGGSVAAMENEKGVVIRMRSTTQGVDLNLGVDGIAVSLRK